MKKILLVGPYKPINCGLTTHIQQFEAKLRESNSVDVLSLLNTEAIFKVNFKSLKFYLYAKRHFRNYNEVFIHFTSEYYLYSTPYFFRVLNIIFGFNLFKLFRLSNVKVVLHEQPTCRFFFQKIFNKLVFCQANKLIFFSEVEKNKFEASNNTKLENFEIISLTNFYVKYFDENIRDSILNLKPNNDFKTILFIGFVKESKGIDLVCQLFSKYEYSNLCLYIVGTAQSKSDQQFYESLINQYSDCKSMKIVNNYVEDKEFDQWIISVDYIIFPYKRIFNSGVLARAKLYQKKVIVSDLPELTHLIDEDDLVFKNQLELHTIISKISNT